MATSMQSQVQGPADQPLTLRAGKAPRHSKRGWLIAGVALLAFAGIFGYGVLARLRNAATVRA